MSPSRMRLAPELPVVPEEIERALGAPPTPEQWEAISMPLEPFVVVAGAGSGKTSVIAARIVYLALVALGRVEAGHSGVLPGDVLCLTFTNKATENLMLRVRSALSTLELPDGEEPTVANYHSFAVSVLDRYGLLAGIEPANRVLSAAQRSELCARVLDQMSFKHVSAEWQPTLVEKILTLADQAANHRVSPEEIIRFNERRLDELKSLRRERVQEAALERIELARAVAIFRDLKRQLGVIDFGDQITLALDVVEGSPDVVTDFRSRFQSVVLDEYQDTNVAQAGLIHALFGRGYPIMAVGDPDQNIYAWRGASLFNLLQFEERFPRIDGSRARKLPLYTNFRSGASILSAADRIIAPIPAAQRPDPDKALSPWPQNGSGEVEIARLADEWEEAVWISDRIRKLHDSDPTANTWSSFAVLCRKSRLFVPLQQAFAEAGIPVEIVGLAGLLKLPAIVEVLAYARAAADPFAGVSLARILLGPRYRVGYRDLARVAAWAKDRNFEIRGEDEEETSPFLFAEALDHLDEVSDLSDEGRARLEEFGTELAGLRGQAGRPVGEFLALIIRTIGLLSELDASPEVDEAQATRRNLAAFLDEVHAFSPLEGELTLRAFLDYVQTVEDAERQEWSPVQPSEDDSVKAMTIHQAKGLEFDTVFVPGLAHGILPDVTVQHNPAERAKSLDFELRGDAEVLPAFKGNLSAFRDELKAQELIEERRTFYVALTRARKRLFVTGAHWYGEDVSKAKGPSRFFDELAEWAEGRGVTVDRGGEAVEENPLVGYRARLVRDWPGPALRAESDNAFPSGWRRTALEGAAELQVGSRAPAPGTSSIRTVAAALLEKEREAPKPVPLPTTVSAVGLVDFRRCPKLFYWSVVRPLPRFSGPAARIGSQIHAWIERQSSGQTSLLELDEPPDATAEELAGEPGRVERLQKRFLDSRFARSVPLYAERSFLLYLSGFVVKGRIDAIFGDPAGPWEVVDYKTGRRPPEDDALAGLQLEVYGLACKEVFGKSPEDITLTYFYLASGEEVSRPAGDLSEARARIVESLEAIAGGLFGPQPGPQCRWCDFRSFCDAGTSYLASED